jgi:hypothetical protein
MFRGYPSCGSGGVRWLTFTQASCERIAGILRYFLLCDDATEIRIACDLFQRAVTRCVVSIMQDICANSRLRMNYAASLYTLVPNSDMRYRVLTSSPRVAQGLILREAALNTRVRRQNWSANGGGYAPIFVHEGSLESAQLHQTEIGALELAHAWRRFARTNLYRAQMVHAVSGDTDPLAAEAEFARHADDQRMLQQLQPGQRVLGLETLKFLKPDREERGCSSKMAKREDVEFWLETEPRWPKSWRSRLSHILPRAKD